MKLRLTIMAVTLGLLLPTVHAQNATPQVSPPPPGAGMGRHMTPEQRQQRWEQMRQQGFTPGMGRQMTPEQRQRHWQRMQQQGLAPGMGRRMMTPPSAPAPAPAPETGDTQENR